MEAEMDDVHRVEQLVKRAHQASGLAAYHHFFAVSSPATRAAYEAALATEAEAEALLTLVRGAAPTVHAAGPPAAKS